MQVILANTMGKISRCATVRLDFEPHAFTVVYVTPEKCVPAPVTAGGRGFRSDED